MLVLRGRHAFKSETSGLQTARFFLRKLLRHGKAAVVREAAPLAPLFGLAALRLFGVAHDAGMMLAIFLASHGFEMGKGSVITGRMAGIVVARSQ